MTKVSSSAFIRAMGNGVDATRELTILVKDAQTNRDLTVINNSLASLAAIKDMKGVQAVRRIMKAVFPKVKLEKNKAGVTSLVLPKGAKADKEALERLSECAKRGLSIRDNLVKKVENKEETAYDLDKALEGNASKALKEGTSLAAYLMAAEKAFKIAQAKVEHANK